MEIPRKWAKIKWARAKDFLSNYLIFDNQIEPSEIQQGALNNFYFLSVVSALSESSDRVRNIFLTDSINF
jgi:hypothetical protein